MLIGVGIMATEKVLMPELTTVRLVPFTAIDPFSMVMFLRLDRIQNQRPNYRLLLSLLCSFQFDPHGLEQCDRQAGAQLHGAFQVHHRQRSK